MLDEKKKMDLHGYRILAHLARGGEIESNEPELVPGRDIPAGSMVGLLEAFG